MRKRGAVIVKRPPCESRTVEPVGGTPAVPVRGASLRQSAFPDVAPFSPEPLENMPFGGTAEECDGDEAGDGAGHVLRGRTTVVATPHSHLLVVRHRASARRYAGGDFPARPPVGPRSSGSRSRSSSARGPTSRWRSGRPYQRALTRWCAPE